MEKNQTPNNDSELQTVVEGNRQRIEILEGRFNAFDFSNLSDTVLGNLFAALQNYERIHGGSL